MKNLGLIVDNPNTFVSLGKFTTSVLIGIGALYLIVLFEIRKIKGSILMGILLASVLGIFFKQVELPSEVISIPPSIAPIMFKLNIWEALQWGMVGTIFSFMFVDLFDSVGTIVACSYEAKRVEEDGSIKKIDKMLEADAVATIAGALLGTSTTTTYIESASGITDGARTGLASIFTGLFFLVALFFAPIISTVPAFATAPALIIIGVLMFKNIKEINFSDFKIGVPAYLTVILMPLTFSIATGLTFGFLSYIIISVLSGDFKKLSPVMWIIGILSMINLTISVGY